jgi:hypothetical protein
MNMQNATKIVGFTFHIFGPPEKSLCFLPLFYTAKPHSTLAIQGEWLKNRILAVLLPDSPKTLKNNIPEYHQMSRKKCPVTVTIQL